MKPDHLIGSINMINNQHFKITHPNKT